MMRFLPCLAVVLVMALTVPAHAVVDKTPKIKAEPAAVRQTVTAAGDGAANVRLREQLKDDVPDFIRNQMELIAKDCTGDAANVRLVKTYRYASQRTSRLKASSDYILDLKGLKPKPNLSCVIGKACDDNGECLLVGYRSVAYNEWQQDFKMPAASWKLEAMEDEDGNGFSALRLFSKAACTDKDGDLDEGCATDYLWSDTGLKQHMTHSREEEAPAEEAPAAAAPVETHAPVSAPPAAPVSDYPLPPGYVPPKQE